MLNILRSPFAKSQYSQGQGPISRHGLPAINTCSTGAVSVNATNTAPLTTTATAPNTTTTTTLSSVPSISITAGSPVAHDLDFLMGATAASSVSSEVVITMANSSASQEPVTDVKPTCLICDNILGPTAIQCFNCELWMHPKCRGVPTVKGKLPGYLDNEWVRIFCDKCCASPHSDAQPITHESVQLSNRFSVLEEKVLAQDKKLDLILDSVVLNVVDSDSVDDQAGRAPSYSQIAKRGIPTSNSKIVHRNPEVAEIARDAVKECFEEEKRLRSVIIEKLVDTGDAKKDDLHVSNILDELGIDPMAIEDVHRMPRFRAPDRISRNSRPRPVKVVLKDSFAQRILLARARDLRHSKHYHGTFVRRSMSTEEHSSLRDLKFRCFMLKSQP